jgi:general secretion pathway protein N
MGAIAHRRLAWCIYGLAVVLAGGLVAEAWPKGDDRFASASLPSVVLPPTTTPAPDAPPIDDWVETALNRPLFAPDRRPDDVAAAPDEALPRLSGTIRLADTSLAMFQPRTADGSAKSEVVGEGADLAGWTITDITSEGVTLVRDGRIATLRLSYDNRPVQPHRLGMMPTRVLHDKRTSPFLQP